MEGLPDVAGGAVGDGDWSRVPPTSCGVQLSGVQPLGVRPTGPEVPEGCPYDILEQLGEGGMAIVYRARHNSGGADVALKLARPIAEDGEARLHREISVQSQLDHPGIMPIFDHSSDGLEPWFTMPVADGSVKKLWQRQINEVRHVVEQAAQALAFAHDAGFVHRDVSPGNLLRMNGDRWVVADWGLVRRPLGQTTQLLTTTGRWGTAGYAAPELQSISPHEATPAADVYSLGRLAAWMLTGSDPQPNVDLLPPGPWRGVIAEATRSDPHRRIQSMAALLERMDQLLDHAASTDVDRAESQLAADDWAPEAESPVWGIITQQVDDGAFLIDVVAQIRGDAVSSWAREEPGDAAVVAIAMCQHLVSIDWGRRDFQWANQPLRWARAAARGVAASGEFGHVEDIATELFIACERWDRWDASREVGRWLSNVRGETAEALARAIRRSGAGPYLARYVEFSPASRAVTRELPRS